MNLFLDVQCPFSKGTLHCFVVKLVVREQPNRCTCVTAIEDYTDPKNLTVKKRMERFVGLFISSLWEVKART